ncbi:hypothetical protein AAFP35_24325 [Gordonia sp. CPCC 206044]|uniref:hypothetical protein n=1 Tax=Gordonia sp. CPCC 206044 TaxID=3140793 RepID=UPI003AF3641A
MTHTADLTTWWNDRTDAQKAALRAAADSRQLPEGIAALLIDTHCPEMPVGTEWLSNQTGVEWHMPTPLRKFIRELPPSDDVAALIAQEAEAAEQNLDQPLPEHVTVTRHRSNRPRSI